MPNKILIIIICLFFIIPLDFISAQSSLAVDLSGRILLQVEQKGEAWYVNPRNFFRYYLGRPSDAYNIMRKLGTGITDNDLKKIPIGILEYEEGQDSDNDGLTDILEKAIGSSLSNTDSDHDGYDDLEEITHDYSPIGPAKMPIDYQLVEKNLGKIFLQVEKNGEAWYLNPTDKKRYYLGRPDDAFDIMRGLGLGISDSNLLQIPLSYTSIPEDFEPEPEICQTCQSNSSAESVFNSAISAVKNGNVEKLLNYLDSSYHQAAEYTMEFMDANGEKAMAAMMDEAGLSKSGSSQVIYTVKFNSISGGQASHDYVLEKKDSGAWKLMNL